MQNNIQETLMNRFVGKLQRTVGHKADLYIGDYRPINQTSARVLFGYTIPRMPARADIDNFVIAEFDGKVTPVWDTALAYPEQNAVSVVLAEIQPTLPLDVKDDRDVMIPITAATFMDTKLNDTWEIVEAGNGKQCLQRVSTSTIDELIQERKNRMFIKAAAVSFDDLQEVTASSSAQKGDEVRFFWLNQARKGKITKANGKGYTVAEDSGDVYPNLPTSAIVEILTFGEGTRSNSQEYQREFYTKVYGPDQKEFVDKLVRGIA